MAYYIEYFIEEDNKLKHIASSVGSDSPTYFTEVETIEDWNSALEKVSEINNFWWHKEKHIFPWNSYKTSDHLLVLRKNRKYWFQFWKPKYQVWIDGRVNNSVSDPNNCYFQKIKLPIGPDHYDINEMELLELPILKNSL